VPAEVRLFVRTALVCFAISMLLGAALVGMKQIAGVPVPWSLVVVHTHLALVGGMVLMVMGVAFWMFPLDQKRFPETRGRYAPLLARAVYGLVAGGLLLRAVVEPIQGDGSGGILGFLLVAAAALQAMGMLVFLIAIWPRVRSVTMP